MFLGLLPAPFVTWTIAVSTVAAMFVSPRRIPEAIWACLGAGLLLDFHLVPLLEALGAVTKGYNVYLFLTGMMVLAEACPARGRFRLAWRYRLASRRRISRQALRFDLPAVLLFCSATGKSLGAPTYITALAITLFITLWDRQAPLAVGRGVSWSVLPLVAGLFRNRRSAGASALHELRRLRPPCERNAHGD